MEIILQLRPELEEALYRTAKEVFEEHKACSVEFGRCYFRECRFTDTEQVVCLPEVFEVYEGNSPHGLSLNNLVGIYDELQYKTKKLKESEEQIRKLKADNTKLHKELIVLMNRRIGEKLK